MDGVSGVDTQCWEGYFSYAWYSRVGTRGKVLLWKDKDRKVSRVG